MKTAADDSKRCNTAADCERLETDKVVWMRRISCDSTLLHTVVRVEPSPTWQAYSIQRGTRALYRVSIWVEEKRWQRRLRICDFQKADLEKVEKMSCRGSWWTRGWGWQVWRKGSVSATSLKNFENNIYQSYILAQNNNRAAYTNDISAP